MATVYIWGRLSKTGHASVGIDGNYLSFNPIDRNWLSDASGTPGYLCDWDDDYKRHGAPISEVTIDHLDEDEMNAQIREYDSLIDNRRLEYNLFKSNCSTLAAELLLKGARQSLDAHKTMNQLLMSVKRMPFSHDHGRVTELLMEMTEDFTVMCARGRKLGPLGKFLAPIVLLDLAIREFSWTPGDVQKLARQFAAHNYR